MQDGTTMDRTIRKNYMKKYKYVVCIGLLVSGLLLAIRQDEQKRGRGDEELFLRGNKYYAEEKYDEALACYGEMHKKGRAVLYNMGNCLFNKEDYSGALVYWSRAQENSTTSEYNLIMRNKDLAFEKLGRKKELSWWNALIVFLRSQLPSVSLLFLQLIFLACWLLFIMVVYWQKPMRFKRIFKAFLSLYITITGILLMHCYEHSNAIAAIIVKKDAHLFTGPDKGFHAISPVLYADDVRVKETREGWHKIQYADMIGWVEADVIQII